MASPLSPAVSRTTAELSWRHWWDHFLARWGVRRMGHRVAPGLWALGNPSPDSPVLVTANYTLSFDALRSALRGRDAWILVLDTCGVNVWCAAGEGTFGTAEMVARVVSSGLAGVVGHRRLIVPQLGASGVAAREVARRTGFAVAFGPVRARDLPGYLDSGKITPEMRRVTFTLAERMVLIPVEIVNNLKHASSAAALAFVAGGVTPMAAVAAAVLAGVILFPIFLPWLPTREFSTKGFLLGGLVALPFGLAPFRGGHLSTAAMLASLTALLTLPPITAYLALNFTGSTPLTSKTGVKREISAYIPLMAGMFGSGLLCGMATLLLQVFGGSPR